MKIYSYILKSLMLSGFFILCLESFSQQYTFVNYSTEQGLAQSQVSAMVQDKRGYLWFATFGGLSRFDGLEFVNYTKNDGLVENQLYSVFLDSKNRIWIGAISAYSVYDGLNFTSKRFPESHSGFNIISICEDKSGKIWFALEGGGLACTNGERLDFYGLESGLDLNVRSVFCDASGQIYAGTRNGLYQFKGSRFEPVSFNGTTEYNISALAEDNNGKLWIGTYDEGVFHENDEGDFTNYTSFEGLINDGVRTIFVDKDQQVWFGTKGGVSKFNGRSFQNFGIQQGLINNNIKFIGQDSEGNIWFGTDGKGILKLSGEAFTTYTVADGLSSDFVMSITEAEDHALWFATYGEGVVRYADGVFSVYTDENGLANNTVWSCVRSGSKIWFGTSNGVSVFDGKKFTSYTTDDGLLSNKVTSLYADPQGRIWIGNRDGLSVFYNGEIKNYSDADGLVGGNIRGIFKDKSGMIWLGGASGLFSFNGEKFQQYRFDDSIPDNTVYCIISDQTANGLWVGTKYGLFHFTNGKFTNVSLGESVNANNINFLISEGEMIWVGTNSGIFQLNGRVFIEENKTVFRNFSRLEGVRGLESNMNAAFRDSRGMYWFGTDGGLVRYDPVKLNKNGNQIEPFIHITGVKLFFDEVDWKKYAKNFNSETGLAVDPIVPYNKNHFTFYFTGISHTNPQKVKYRFILEGFDQDWSPITDARSITYSNLPGGSYIFKVIACNDSGIWTSTPATFSFVITPPFWNTWWFFILIGLVILFSVYLVYRWRIAVIRRNNERDQLIYKSKLLSLEQQTLNASMNRHFIFNALNSIQYYINKQDKLEANRYLTSFAKLIRKNLDSSASGNLVTLSEELERLELYLSLENMRFKNKFYYELFLDENIDTEGVMIPPMLLQPYVENAIWHGILPMDHPGTIWIKIIPNDDRSIRITITDDGIGINTSLKSKEKHGADHISRGIQITSGRLSVLKKLTNENLRIDGPYELHNEDGTARGTEVVLIIPGAGVLENEKFDEEVYS
ncbi:MAG: histidine kinase [Flavobacteriales bacterium]|nr:histidine kinase [Flavobacteriales bacterium]